MLWYHGAPLTNPLSLLPTDPALLYGATVFTTLRVYENNLDHPFTGWEAHCDRVSQSLQTFHWDRPNWDQVRSGAERLASQYAVLRITLFPDGRELITGRSLPEDLATRQRQGVIAWVADMDYSRPLPGHKTGNYLGCWLALQAAQRQGAQEAILINPEGHWLETSTGSLWGWAAGQWWTPPLTAGILPGVARSQILTGLAQQGQDARVGDWTAEVRSRFTHLAYSNSVVEVVPIRQILRTTTPLNYNPDHAPIQVLRQALHRQSA